MNEMTRSCTFRSVLLTVVFVTTSCGAASTGALDTAHSSEVTGSLEQAPTPDADAPQEETRAETEPEDAVDPIHESETPDENDVDTTGRNEERADEPAAAPVKVGAELVGRTIAWDGTTVSDALVASLLAVPEDHIAAKLQRRIGSEHPVFVLYKRLPQTEWWDAQRAAGTEDAMRASIRDQHDSCERAAEAAEADATFIYGNSEYQSCVLDALDDAFVGYSEIEREPWEWTLVRVLRERSESRLRITAVHSLVSQPACPRSFGMRAIPDPEIRARDMDGDGRVELAVTYEWYSCSLDYELLEGWVETTFIDAEQWVWQFAMHRRSASELGDGVDESLQERTASYRFRDVNGDGHPDLIVRQARFPTVCIVNDQGWPDFPENRREGIPCPASVTTPTCLYDVAVDGWECPEGSEVR